MDCMQILSMYDTQGLGTLEFSQFKQLAKDGVLLHGAPPPPPPRARGRGPGGTPHP